MLLSLIRWLKCLRVTLMLNAGLMTSLTDQWATPKDLFDELDAEFSFDLDACASEWNYKVANYFDEAADGLAQVWTGTVWCNPPYGRVIKDWVRKAYESAKAGATVVMLIPARTDTAYWHDYVMKGEVRFLRGRVKFVSADGDGSKPAPFPSAIVIFKP